jgi:hypothetical protein
MNPTTKTRLIRGSLWVAHYLLLIPLGLGAGVAAMGMLCLSGAESLRNRTAAALGIDGE